MPVTLWIVVIQQRTIPRLFFITLITGARQLVVQEALVIILWEDVKRLSLQPRTTLRAGDSFTGAETTTR